MRKSCFYNHQEIINIMRKLWSQHVYWTRFFYNQYCGKTSGSKVCYKQTVRKSGRFR